MRERALVGHDACTPERVGEDLARALAALLCRGLAHPAGAGASCGDCLAAGHALAQPVGRVLFACRCAERVGGRERLRPLTAADYDVIGRSFALLEPLAGTRASSGVPAGGRRQDARSGGTAPAPLTAKDRTTPDPLTAVHSAADRA